LSEEQEANEKMVKKHRVAVGSDFERYRLDATRRLPTTKYKLLGQRKMGVAKTGRSNLM
jgi:hypothetical protein